MRLLMISACIIVMCDVSLTRIIQTTDLHPDMDTILNGIEGTTPPSEITDVPVTTTTDVCSLPKDVGPCTFFSTMFYYDRKSDKCEIFRYGGCLGNENRFYDFEPCEEGCRKQAPSPSVCNEPRDSGNCEDNVDQYYYDTTTNECKHFNYTGCGGSANRFHDEQSCQDLCKIPGDICKLPPDSGFGRFNATFFFYNSATGSCEEFSYKGALGNDNRFYDKDECESECKLH